jgi:hypothetical protein
MAVEEGFRVEFAEGKLPRKKAANCRFFPLDNISHLW